MPTTERIVIPLPCGHLVDDYPGVTATLRCTHCARAWTAVRAGGGIEVTEVRDG